MNINHTIAILAYNNHELTKINLQHLINQGYRENILLFDNGSKPNFEALAQQLNIRYIKKKKNIFVNPAWNEIFKIEKSDYLTLLNNDCFILSKLYFKDVLSHMKKNKIGITSCKTKNISHLKKGSIKRKKYFYFANDTKAPFLVDSRRQGWLMTIDLAIYKSLEYLIPDYIKVWYGDDWIWSQFIKNKIKTGVYKNRYAIHMRNSTISSELIKNVIKKDTSNLEKYGDWHREVARLIHKRSRLFARYV